MLVNGASPATEQDTQVLALLCVWYLMGRQIYGFGSQHLDPRKHWSTKSTHKAAVDYMISRIQGGWNALPDGPSTNDPREWSHWGESLAILADEILHILDFPYLVSPNYLEVRIPNHRKRTRVSEAAQEEGERR